jgi:hypothetical protein
MADQPSSDPSILAGELREILTRSVEGNLELLTRVSNLARDAANSLGANAGRAQQQPGDVINRIVRLNLSYLSLLSKHGLAFADELTTVTERALGLKSSSASPTFAPGASPPPRVEINLNARVGETAAGAFLVENTRPEPVHIAFEASQIVDRQNAPVEGAAVRFDPAALDLKPGTQVTVKVLIKISTEFKPGELYFSRIRIAGFDEKEVLIALNILSPVPKRPEATPARRPAKNQKRTRRKEKGKRGQS